MRSVIRLVEIMKQLRDPSEGCPWDREQTPASILPYTLEEVYELAEAIERSDPVAVCGELGDLLFHLVFYARMAEESGLFDFEAVVAGIVEKLERRHPHVFGGERVAGAAEQSVAWERIKADERRQAGAGQKFLDGISTAMPAMLRAHKLQKRAATVGFDWDAPEPVLAKVEEELGEIRAALSAGSPPEQVEAEVGDLLFAVINCARHLGVDPEIALRAANRKFEQRFSVIESALQSRGRTLEDATLEEMEELWQAAKRR